MKCKLCGAQLEADMTVCPLCGAKVDAAEGYDEAPEAVSAPVTPEPPAEETPAAPAAEDPAAAEVPAEPEAPAGEAPSGEPEGGEPGVSAGETPVRRGGSGGKLAILIAVVVVVAAVLIYAVVSIFGGGDKDGSDTSEPGGQTVEAPAEDPLAMNHVDEEGNFVAHSYTKADEDITADEMSTVVATCGDEELTNAVLSFYYWQQVSNYGSYAQMMGLDFSQPLADQMVSDTATWEDMFLQNAMQLFWWTSALYQTAEEAGYTLDQATSDSLDSLAQSMAEEAATNGFASEDEYLQSAYGPYVTMDDYLQFCREMMTSSGYLNELYGGIEYDEDDVKAYFQEHEDEYAAEGLSMDDPNMVNVRHILIEPVADEGAETDESGNPVLTEQNWADAKAKAEEIYDMWLDGEATEDSFAELAGTYSDDPGSASNGGLYEDVYPGQMVQAFNDWCFDESRQPGDSGIVETDYGYHIMYFSSTSDRAYWYVLAEQDYLGDRQQEILNNVVYSLPVQVDYDKVVLATTDMLS